MDRMDMRYRLVAVVHMEFHRTVQPLLPYHLESHLIALIYMSLIYMWIALHVGSPMDNP